MWKKRPDYPDLDPEGHHSLLAIAASFLWVTQSLSHYPVFGDNLI
jgi:hypothetical protein